MAQLKIFQCVLKMAWTPAVGCLVMLLGGCDVSDNSGPPNIQQTDPVVVDLPIAYVQRPLPLDEDGNPVLYDVLDPTAFNPGAELILKERAAASARETVLTASEFTATGADEITPPLYDVKDLEVSADGKKLLFAMRAPEIEDADDDEQPKWNIWEYNFEDSNLRRIIQSDNLAEQGHDVSPHYLPDGRILFASSRQVRTKAILLDEIKPIYPGLDDKRRDEALVLHVMSPDGDNIEQLSYNVSHDLQPTLLSTGEIVYLRWDGINGHDELSLYKANSDGSDVQPLYGFHSQDTGTNDSEGVFFQPRELEDGRIMVILQPRTTERLGGDIVAIDTANFIAIDQPTHANAGASGPGQVSLVANNVDSEGVLPSLGGYFSTAYPLHDNTNRLLVSWSQCRLIDPDTLENAPCTAQLLDQGAIAAPPLFGLWVYDTEKGTQLPVKIPDEGVMYTDAVVVAPRPVAENWSATDIDPTLVNAQLGVVNIRSIYDIDGLDAAPGGTAALADPVQTPVDQRPARFLRIVKNVPIPDDDVLDFDDSAFGRSSDQGMRDIIGYVPIEPDGSAQFKIPSDIPFMLDVVDANGKRIGRRHENWLHLRPGEQRQCKGCHTADSQLPHGRRDAEDDSPYVGAVGGIAFPNTLVLDAFGTPQPLPEFGETMAEYYSRLNGPRTPSVDLIFSDEWTDPAATAPGQDIQRRYVNISASVNANPRDSRCAPLANAPPAWGAPTRCDVTGSWNSLCRITINYIEHIQPLWQADRRGCDDLGNVVIDHTCTSCHSRGPAGAVVIPAGQLELTGEVSQDRNDFITSYAELIFQDNEQQVVDNSLVDVVLQIDTGEFEVDANGNLVLDANGAAIPIFNLVTIPVNPPMSTNGARASNDFFNRFEGSGNHAGYLSSDELKLIAEWLDIGAQYYNNPFDAPAD